MVFFVGEAECTTVKTAQDGKPAVVGICVPKRPKVGRCMGRPSKVTFQCEGVEDGCILKGLSSGLVLAGTKTNGNPCIRYWYKKSQVNTNVDTETIAIVVPDIFGLKALKRLVSQTRVAPFTSYDSAGEEKVSPAAICCLQKPGDIVRVVNKIGPDKFLIYRSTKGKDKIVETTDPPTALKVLRECGINDLIGFWQNGEVFESEWISM